MTYRSSPLPAAVAQAQRVRYESELVRDYSVRSELLAELRQCLALAARGPAAAPARWQSWARARRERVASTLGAIPAVALGRGGAPAASAVGDGRRGERYRLTFNDAPGAATRGGELLQVAASARSAARLPSCLCRSCSRALASVDALVGALG